MEDFAEKLTNPEFTGNADHWDLAGGASYNDNAVDIEILAMPIIEKLATSADYGGLLYASIESGDYVYAGGATTNKVYKYQKSDMAKVAESASCGGTVRCICESGDFLYVGLVTTNKVYKLQKSDLVKVAESADCLSSVLAIAEYGDYIFAVGGTSARRVYKLQKSDLVKVTESVDYGWNIYALAVNSDSVYICGALTLKVWRLRQSDLVKVAESASFGAYPETIVTDDTYVFVSGYRVPYGTNPIWKLNKTTLAKISESSAIFASCLAQDTDYLYASGKGNYLLYKIQKSNMATVAEYDELYGGSGHTICDDDDYVYSSAGNYMWKFAKAIITDASLSQPIVEMVSPITVGNKEEITIVISGYVKGNVVVTCGGVTIATLSSNGTHVNNFLVTDDTKPVIISSSVATELVIESVSLKRYASKIKVYVDGSFQLKPIKIRKSGSWINCVVRKFNGVDFEDI